jgi:hypothetical protein
MWRNVVFALIILSFYSCDDVSRDKQIVEIRVDSVAPVSLPPAPDSMDWVKGIIHNNHENDSLIQVNLKGQDKDFFIRSVCNRDLKYTTHEFELLEKVVVKEYAELHSVFVLAVIQEFSKENGRFVEEKGRKLYYVFTGTAAIQNNRGIWAAGQLDIGKEEFSRFVPGNYKVTEDEPTVVFETIQHFMYAGGGGSNTTFRMLVARNDTIRQVFSTLLQSAGLRAGEYAEDGTRDHYDVGNTDELAVITVQSEKMNGFSHLKKSMAGSEAIFKFDGEKYVTIDKDPVENVNN